MNRRGIYPKLIVSIFQLINTIVLTTILLIYIQYAVIFWLLLILLSALNFTRMSC